MPDMSAMQMVQIVFWRVRSYKKLPVDVQPGSQILCADGSIVLEVLKCNPDAGTVRCRCTNNATLGYATPCLANGHV